MRTTKLKKAKVKLSDRKKFRSDNWYKVDAIIKLVEMGRPKQVDLWWARSFLKSVLADPFADGDKEKLYEVKLARKFMDILDEKYPVEMCEPPDKKVDKRRRVRSKNRRKEVQKEMNHATTQLAILTYKSRRLERQFHAMLVSHPKWRETYDLVKSVRQDIKRWEKVYSTAKAML